MNHLLILPVLIPLLAGAFLVVVFVAPLALQRLISLVSTALLVLIALLLFRQVMVGNHVLYTLGNWSPPFGILLVADRLSVLMLLITSALAVFCAMYAGRGDDRKGAHFHALLQFQLAGINGAFLTGDLFNLFVCFEILLIASYALLLHGGGVARCRASLHYVILNLVGSAMFIIGVGILYGVTGTLNMADLAVRVANAPAGDQPLLTAASLLLLVVFGVKAALLPLLFWLPRAYTAASAPVAALFAIMTKVGIYAMLRVFSLIFGLETGLVSTTAWQWLWPLALATLALGGIGVLGATNLRNLTAYMVIVSTGTLLATLALGTREAIGAGLFYLVHSTLMTATFFLLADLIARQRGVAADHMVVAAAMKDHRILGSVYFIGAIAFAGLPPFSGFISKVWILQVAGETGNQTWLWPILLVAGFMILIALSRAGSKFFWRQSGARPHQWRADPARLGVVIAMVLGSAALSMAATPVMTFMLDTADAISAPQHYVEAVEAVALRAMGGL
ncbi:monovalent cation/H+ antiporter subunit D [Litchfieldella qijiaojingensis]|uniref:Monovalent cation/H+ antiporter subunit D n=1 Tax=Litchfieldella qijiaojingensis TaxID=980347 RepID=A0ABQ2YJ39_9GAMM|nr:monovalent cation/H+ antiporter subunit D [Halomonas qijiaojingensis]GGX85961.1 monovalent cation/H+ antiporter subunit D [Halomonas qijiaojingensis]